MNSNLNHKLINCLEIFFCLFHDCKLIAAINITVLSFWRCSQIMSSKIALSFPPPNLFILTSWFHSDDIININNLSDDMLSGFHILSFLKVQKNSIHWGQHEFRK